MCDITPFILIKLKTINVKKTFVAQVTEIVSINVKKK